MPEADLFAAGHAPRTPFASPLSLASNAVADIGCAYAPRRVELRYATGPARALRPNGRVLERTTALPAVGQLLGDLGVEAAALAVRQVEAGGERLAVLVVPPPGERHRSGRIVAFVLEGLSAAELMLALAWWAAYGRAVASPPGDPS